MRPLTSFTRRGARPGHVIARSTLLLLLLAATAPAAAAAETLRLSVQEYRDRMKGGWIGQIAGVSWGAPTEFHWKGQIIPADKMPAWKPAMINDAFGQDDLYVEMTFLRTLEQHGWQASLRQAGMDFANSGYPLWHANRAGRDNLRAGIAPPDSGHPAFNKHADDIDYQIEADFSGLIAPGMPQVAIELGEKFGRLMNYGDGLFGGQFVGGMYAAAFFERDPVRLVEAGLRCIPQGSQYAECVRDTLRWHKEFPDNWEQAWRRLDEKYHRNPAYRRASCNRPEDPFNIDAKLNGAYIVMGLLYGGGDLDQTIIIATRCGQDSDCNPSSAAGVLFTTLGYSRLPARFNTGLDEQRVFSHTAYNFPRLLDVCEKLARQAVVQQGGRIEREATGEEVFVIPVRAPRPSALEQCWEPGPVAGSRFTPDEQARIVFDALPQGVKEAAAKVAPGWTVTQCGQDMEPGLRAEWQGRKNVLVTHPLDDSHGCVLSRKLRVPDGKPSLRLVVGHDPRGDFDLVVRVDGQQVLRKPVGPATATEGVWLRARVDLSAHAGKEVKIELVNQPSGWSYEAAYWAEIALGVE